MPKLEMTIERIEITPAILKRQPFDYSSNESGVGLMAIRTEWPIELEVEGEGLDGVEEAVEQLLDRFGSKAFEFTVALLKKDREPSKEEPPESEEESSEEEIPF